MHMKSEKPNSGKRIPLKREPGEQGHGDTTDLAYLVSLTLLSKGMSCFGRKKKKVRRFHPATSLKGNWVRLWERSGGWLKG